MQCRLGNPKMADNVIAVIFINNVTQNVGISKVTSFSLLLRPSYECRYTYRHAPTHTVIQTRNQDVPTSIYRMY